MTVHPDRPTLGVGMVGYAFMGAAHSQAWRTAPRFFDLPLRPAHERRLRARPRARRRRRRTARLGRRPRPTGAALIARDDVDLVDICTPGDTHAEIAIAALEAGKHVLCEKPLANTVAEAEAMAAAAERGRRDGVRVDGRLHLPPGAGHRAGPPARRRRPARRIRHVRAQYLQDWIVDPEAPLSWRLQKDKAGSGALGDIGAHIVDLTQYITGQTARPASSACSRRSSPNGRCRRRSSDAVAASRATETRHGHRRRRGGLPRPLRRRRARLVRGDPVRARPQERASASRSTARPAAWRSTSRT